MGKKRGKDKSSSHDGDFEVTVQSCRHIIKGTDKTLLKKLSTISDWMSCQDCKHERSEENISTHLPQDSETSGMWLCLKCGHRGCGRNSENRHAIQHFEIPRSEPHCLVVSLDTWSVWCYICDDEIQYSRTGYLAQLLTNLKKQTSSDSENKQGISTGVEEEDILLGAEHKTEAVTAEEGENKENKENRATQKKNCKKEAAGKSVKSDTTEGNGGVSVKGLSNLGNTCFFNAVIQNLSQTQLLRQTLNKVTEEKTSLNIKPAVSMDLEPIVVQLDRPGSLTVAMCQLLNEIQESKKGVVTPRELFTQVCKKAARFKGFQQQDSQELLRYLLDGMRAEELKRLNSGITEALKGSRKGADGGELTTLVKEYEKNGTDKNFVDLVFGGELTSTIMCQQCKTISVVTEMFLDLSLPVADEAYRKKSQKNVVQKSCEMSQGGRSSPVSTGENDDVSTGTGSKYQQKKAKKQAKKQAKHQRRQQKLDGRVTLEKLKSQSATQDEHTDNNDNPDDEAHEETSASEESPAGVDKSEQNLDPVDDEQENEEDGDSTTDCESSAAVPLSIRFNVLSDERQLQGEAAILDEKGMDGEEDSLLVGEIEKVTLDDVAMEETNTMEESMETEEEEETKEYTIINQDPELAFHTLATRTTPQKQECSVQSCLFQFTEVETLTQNNSLLCVTCTKHRQKNNKAAESKKNIYTDALKQMLISCPPPVLTLHLKRFQQSGYSICKVNRHVEFPLVLDLAPFCAVKCKDETEGGAQVLYSLYGLVEHSGTMRSGHYTAYVKVRPNYPNPPTNGVAAEGAAEPPRGSWFHISDTSVQPVSESKVQSCQAYLLFYERIK